MSLKASLTWVISLVLFAVLLTFSILDEGVKQNLFIYGSYYILSAMFGVWVWALIQACHPFDVRAFIYEHRWGLFSAVVLTGVVWFGVARGFKVLSDETNLLAVSRSLLYNRTIYNTTMGRWYYDNFWGFNNELPQRPFAFCYLLYLVHLVLGYSVNNGYYLNGLILLCSLILVYLVIARRWGFKAGLAGMLLTVSNPIITICAASQGYDLLAFFLFLLACVLLMWVLNSNTPQNHAALWMTLILLANTRHETVIFMPIFYGMMLLFRRIQFKMFFHNPLVYAITPLFLLLRVWQTVLLPNRFENPDGVAVIGVENLSNHWRTFVDGIFDFHFELPYAIVLNSVAIALVLLLIGIAWFKKLSFDNRDHKHFAIIALLSVVIGTAIYLAHHFGVYSHPTQARFFLIFSFTVVMMPFVFNYFTNWFEGKHLLAMAIFAFAMYHPIALEGRFENKLTLIRKTKFIDKFLTSLGTRNFLLIADRPGQFTAQEYGAVNFVWARANIDKLISDLDRHLYQAIYVLDDVDYPTTPGGQPKPQNPLPDSLKLEVVAELQNKATEFIRISKVIYPVPPAPKTSP